MGRHNLAATRRDEVVSDVVARVEALFDLPGGTLFFADQTGNVVIARRLAWYVLYMSWRYSYPQLAERWGYDQSTIRMGVLAVADLLKYDREIQQRVRMLEC